MIDKRIIPLRDNVYIRVVKQDDVKSNGIIMPRDDKNTSFCIGEVIAVGAGTIDEHGNKIEMDVEPGNQVILGKWSGTKINEDEYLVRIKDILGRYE